LVGEAVAVVESARADGIGGGARARDLEIGRKAQGFRERPHPGAAYVLSSDDVYRGRRIEEPLRAARYRGHLDVGKLLQRKVGKVGGPSLGHAGGPRGERGQQGNDMSLGSHPFAVLPSFGSA